MSSYNKRDERRKNFLLYLFFKNGQYELVKRWKTLIELILV